MPMAWLPMTSISASPGFIDFAGHGLADDDLRSLGALSAAWQAALHKVRDRLGPDRAVDEFFEYTLALPLCLADADWQRQWVQRWYSLNACGLTLADKFNFFHLVVDCCERDVFGDKAAVGRVQIDLLAILRRSVVAVVSGAVELGEEAMASAAELPGEAAALCLLNSEAEAGRAVATLSISIAARHPLSYLSIADQQSLPGLVTERLMALLNEHDSVFSGREEEWLVLMGDICSMAQPALAASRLQREFAEPLVLLSGRGVMLDVTIGAAVSPEHGIDGEALIQGARLARASLTAPEENFAMFDDSLRAVWLQRLGLAEELRLALHSEALDLHLQPQVDLDTGRCFGAELLLRWQRCNGDWVAPPLVIEIIEENGWRAMFTDWLIRSALRLSCDLDEAGVAIGLSLNLTAGDLLDADLPELVAQCLETWRLPGSRFTFELTESAMMANRQRGLDVMHRLRDLGVRLALDDFGTGYSSLSYLATLPLNEIKIDRSFVIAMAGSREGLRIVRAIIDLTHDLGMHSLAEGVEDQAQRAQLLALGCRQAQGYLYARPMGRDAFIVWYRAGKA